MFREWPLVAFTILAQLAVGLYLFLVAPRAWLPDGEGEDALLLPALLAVLVLLVAAGLLSFFHLHRPFRAATVLRNLKSSWLSREILGELSFGALVTFHAVASGLRFAGPGLARAVTGLATVAGLALVLIMARLYMLPALGIWRSIGTPLAFLLTTGALGALGGAFATTLSSGQTPGMQRAGTLGLLSITLLAAVLLAPEQGVHGSRHAPSLRRPPAESLALHLVRIVLLSLGTVVLARTIWAGGAGTGWNAGPAFTLFIVFLLVFTAEVLGRFQFYACHPRK